MLLGSMEVEIRVEESLNRLASDVWDTRGKPFCRALQFENRTRTGEQIKIIQMLVVICALSFAAEASSIIWNVNVTFGDGGTATGTFDFDADAGTPCTSTNTPCGVYSNVNIVTTTGTSVTGVTYTTVCGVGGVTSCTGVSPDSTEVLFLWSAYTATPRVRGNACIPAGPPGPK